MKNDLDLITKEKVLPQGLTIQKLWPLLKFFADKQTEKAANRQTGEQTGRQTDREKLCSRSVDAGGGGGA